MHAAVRWLIQNDPRVEWDPAWGTPINQEDLLETLLTFTEIVFEVFDRTGIVYSEEDADAYLHTWSLIGHYLGIRDDLLPLTRSQTSVLMPDCPASAVRPEQTRTRPHGGPARTGHPAGPTGSARLARLHRPLLRRGRDGGPLCMSRRRIGRGTSSSRWPT